MCGEKFSRPENPKVPPAARAVVVANINSYMAGGTVWRGDDVAPDDGKVSVVAFDGIIHLGNFRLGLARPHELARGTAVELAARAPLPVHVDGEP